MTDEQIREAAIKYDNGAFSETPIAHFMEGAFWYRNQLLKRSTDGYIINDSKKVVEHNGIEYRLQKKNYQVAKYLYDNKGRIINKDEIYANVWEGMIVEERTVDVHLRKIRMGVPGIPIKTVKGVGYIWNVSSNLTNKL